MTLYATSDGIKHRRSPTFSIFAVGTPENQLHFRCLRQEKVLRPEFFLFHSVNDPHQRKGF